MKHHYALAHTLTAAGLALGLLLGSNLVGKAQNISTTAGDGTANITGNGIGYTQGVALDADGNTYVATGNSHVVRKIAPDGTHSTFVGTGTASYGGDGGPASAATLNFPTDVYVSGNALYITDSNNRRIRRVDLASGLISTVAGDGTTNITGNGLGYTQGVALDGNGNLYVATGNSHVVRKIAPDGTHSTFVGTGTASYGGDGGPASAATLNFPVDVYVSGNALYIADSKNYRIRKVDLTSNVITSVAGDGTAGITNNGIGYTQGVSADAGGNVFVATGTASVIRKAAADGTHSTLAGTGTASYGGDGGPASAATFNLTTDVFIYGRDLYVADANNRRIRKVTNVTDGSNTNSTATPLPVKLVSFTAEGQATDGLVRWATASEQQSAYFAVESSTDGRAFRPLAQVAAQGTSTQQHTYQYLDRNLARYGVAAVYYRLRQVDSDGTTTYSPVQALPVAAANRLALQAYPNPARNSTLHLLLQGTSTQPLTVTVTDALGQLVLMRSPAPEEGATIQLPEAAHWPRGIYLLRAEQGTHQQLLKIQCE